MSADSSTPMDSTVTEAFARLEAACSRAEDEFPKLAAPDGTVAVQFTDLRTLLAMRSASLPSADVVEPLLRFHETGGHEGDGSDERIAIIRAALSKGEVLQAKEQDDELSRATPVTDDLDEIEPVCQGLRTYAQKRGLLVLSIADVRRAARIGIAALQSKEQDDG